MKAHTWLLPYLSSVMRSTSFANRSSAGMPSERIWMILLLSWELNEIVRPRSFSTSVMFGWRRNANTRSLYAASATAEYFSTSASSQLSRSTSRNERSKISSQKKIRDTFCCGLVIWASVVGFWFLVDILQKVSGSVAEWLACWTQAQKGLGSNRSHNAVG